MTKIVLKHGTGVPSDTDLEVAEVAIDNVSGAMYTKLADDSVKHLNAAGASSWNDLTDKPTEYPPEAHTQDWSTITNTPADYPPSAHGHAWDEITGKPTEFPPSAHDHDGVYQPVGDYIEDADSDGKQYARQDGAWSEVVIPDGGTGSSVHIGEAPPANPQEGQQWMEVPASGDATMWIYDDGNGGQWLQHPGGKDGAPGADGADGNIADATEQGVIATWDNTAEKWTPDGAVVVSGSNVGIGTSRDFTSGLDVSTSGSSLSPSGAKITGRFSVGDAKSTSVMLGANTDGTPHGVVAGANELGFYTYDGGWHERLRIDATGNATFSQGVFGKAFALANSHYIEKVGDNMAFVASSGGTMTFATGDTGPKLTLDSSGNATFSGKVSAGTTAVATTGQIYASNGSGIKLDTAGILPMSSSGALNNNANDIGSSSRRFKDAYFSGTVDAGAGFTVNGNPLTRVSDLIETLSTLRNATKDETTIKGLRDAIGNAIGGLIEKFEAMQSAATQEISDE